MNKTKTNICIAISGLVILVLVLMSIGPITKNIQCSDMANKLETKKLQMYNNPLMAIVEAGNYNDEAAQYNSYCLNR